MTAADFPVPETRLADTLGLPRKALKEARADVLEKGSHWIHADSGTVCYSRGGIVLTLAHLGIPAEKIALLLPAAPVAEAAPVVTGGEALDLTAPEVVSVTVVRCFTVNKHLLQGSVEGVTVRVRVRDSQKLRKGDVLACRLIAGDLYELAGRQPRRIGRKLT